jgi:hypothetical protein
MEAEKDVCAYCGAPLGAPAMEWGCRWEADALEPHALHTIARCRELVNVQKNELRFAGREVMKSFDRHMGEMDALERLKAVLEKIEKGWVGL